MAHDEFTPQRAVRRSSRLRLAVAGASGGGKTISILRVAHGLAQAMLDMGEIEGGLAGKIGIIDTEQKSARLYADHMLRDGTRMPPFDVIELKPPYTTDRYLKALRSLENAGYPIIAIDQLSHAWAGQGGLLEKLAVVAKQYGGNTWQAFDDITPEQNRFLEALLATPAHLIVSMRSKTAWTTESYQDRQGNTKTRPKRIGMAPIQRAGSEYEFTTLLNLDPDGNVATTIKDRSGLFPMGEPFGPINEKHGVALAKWLYTDEAPEPAGRELGTPDEQLAAKVLAAKGRFDACLSLPDLAKVFETETTAVRKFTIGLEAKRAAVDELIVAKEARKVALSAPVAANAPAPGVALINVDQVEGLERSLLEQTIPPMLWQGEFGIQRLAQLPAAKLDDFKDWIDAQSVIRGAA